MRVSEQTRDLEERCEMLLSIINATREFLDSVGPKDPRSSGFIARRARKRLPLTYLDRRGTLRDLDGERSIFDDVDA